MFSPKKIRILKYEVDGLIVTFCVSFFLFSVGLAQAKVMQWDFFSPSQFVFDSNQIRFTESGASLATINRYDTNNDFVGFGGGTVSGLAWVTSSSWLAKNAADTSTAFFVSRVFDAFATVTWSNLNWRMPRPYFVELPNTSSVELGYVQSNASMINNLFLYHFNEPEGSVSFADTSGNATSLSCVGGSCPLAGVPGRFGESVQFDGLSSFATAGNPASLSHVSALSVEAWIKTNRDSNQNFYQPIIEKWSSSPSMNSEAFSVFDVTTNITTTLQSFSGALFDGHYIYYIPFADAAGGVTNYSSKLLRYDPNGNFNDVNSYSYFDTRNINPESASFSAASFDGRYIYLASLYNGTRYGGLITRYDTTAPLDDPASYTIFDTTSINDLSRGIGSIIFDGRYMYFLAGYAGALRGGYVGIITRYDTTASFTDPAAYSTFNATTLDSNAKGMFYNVFDGRYIYFLPSTGGNKKIMRYDTQAPFESADSYSFFDTNAVSTDLLYLGGGVYDGKYVYFTPTTNASSSVVLRYDTTRNFTESASYAVYNMADANAKAGAYASSVFDGRYIYYIPSINLEGHLGLVTRYDTLAPFTDPTSYSFFDLTGINSLYKGFGGAAFDGRYIYMAHNDVNHEGYMVRYDTTGGNSSFALRYGSFTDGKMSSLPGITGMLNTSQGYYTVSEWGNTKAGQWHHVALVYNGNALNLYVDGVLKRSIAAAGVVTDSATSLLFGAFNEGVGKTFNGALDESAFYSRALSGSEVLDHYLRGAARLKLQVRSCALPDCSDALFVGPDGTNSSYFSTSSAQAAATSSFNFALSPARYFQYKTFFETDTSTYSPELSAVAIAPQRIAANAAFIANIVGQEYQDLHSLAAAAATTSQAGLGYQISDNNSNWYSWIGGKWTQVNDATRYSSIEEISSHLQEFATMHPKAQFFFRIFLFAPNDTDSVQLRSMQLDYDSKTPEGGLAAGGAPAAPTLKLVSSSTTMPLPVVANTTTNIVISLPKLALNTAGEPSKPTTKVATDKKIVLASALAGQLIKKYTYGQTNAGVSVLQQQLKTLGYFPTTHPVTKYYGPITRSAVNLFVKKTAPKKS